MAGSVRYSSTARDARSGRDLPPGKPMLKPRPMAKRSARNSRPTIRHFWCWTGNSRRSQLIRWLSSRKAVLPGTTPAARSSSSLSACSRLTRRPNRSLISWATRRRASNPLTSTPILPIAGGAFGGRDYTPFPLYVALAAMFFPNRPVRLANNRFEQFQSGIKRHAFKIHTRIGVDRATGKMVGFAADHVLDGGGLANFSADVATVAATTALGIYYVPKADVTTYAFHSRGVTAGAMRGFGTLQTSTALEVMVDEICTALPLDPIEFRRRNALATGGRTLAGNAYSVSVRTPEILDKLEQHTIWKERT